MAFKGKLNKAEVTERNLHVNALREKHEALKAAVEAANNAITEHNEKLVEANDAYNEALAEARDWKEALVEDRQNAFDEATEKWQQGDNGEAASAWINEMESIDLDEADAPQIEEIDFSDEDCEQAAALEEMPTDMNG